MVRNSIEKAVKPKGAKLWILCVDYAKAFDTVNHNALWNTLREFCVPQHLIWLMQKLYSKATGVLRIAGEHTDQFPFEKGVRQGCVLSSGVSRGVFWLPGTPPPPTMIFLNQGVTPLLAPTLTSHFHLRRSETPLETNSGYATVVTNAVQHVWRNDHADVSI